MSPGIKFATVELKGILGSKVLLEFIKFYGSEIKTSTYKVTSSPKLSEKVNKLEQILAK